MKISKLQKVRLRELICYKPQLRSGKFTATFTRKDGMNEWQQIAAILNDIPGATKDWRAWRKTWQDIQSRVKSKSAEINKARRATGGGPPPPPLDDFEEGVAALIHPHAVSGHSGSVESTVDFEDPSVAFPDCEVIYDETIPYVPDAAVIQNTPILDHTYTSSSHFEADVVASLPPPPEFDDNVVESLPQPAQQSKKKAKVTLKSLLKEKIELKKEMLKEKKIFYKAFIENLERQSKAMEEISKVLSHK